MNLFEDTFRHLEAYRTYVGRRLYLLFGLTVLATLAEGFGIALLLPLLKATETGDGAVEGRLEEALFSMLQWMGIADSVVWILVFIGIAFVAKGVLKFSEKGYNAYLQAKLIKELKIRLFDAYANMKYKYYAENNTGHFINVINSQVQGFYSSFKSFLKFLSSIIKTISYLAIAAAVTWRFSVMALILGIVVLFAFKRLNNYVQLLSKKSSAELSELNKLLVQALQAYKYIVSTKQVDHLRETVYESIQRYTGYRLRRGIARGFTAAIKEPVSVLFLLSVIIVQVTVFEAPIAPIFVALILFHRGMQSMIGIQSKWQSVKNNVGSLDMVTNEFAALKKYREQGGERSVEALREGIEFQDVSFAYDTNDGLALQDVSLFIPADTTVALVGESGAGKSTLVDMLTLLLRPQRGDIQVDGLPGSEVDLASWREQIGYVSQETVIFDDTIANNICLWKGDYEEDSEVQARVEDAARKAYAHHFIEDLPDGYQTLAGDQGVRLSGGQRQRLFVARELYKRPNLLLLDEATSDLDTESERYIQQSIDDLKGSMTVVIIAHRLSTIKNVDRIYVLDNGQIVESGGYDELRHRDQSQFREMVEMQAV
jgi:subfamily B ATP-binding cassette protein MsbA